MNLDKLLFSEREFLAERFELWRQKKSRDVGIQFANKPEVMIVFLQEHELLDMSKTKKYLDRERIAWGRKVHESD